MPEASPRNPIAAPNSTLVPPAVHAAQAASGLESISRRRTLLRGMGKAGAIAGAALPLRSLATDGKEGMRLKKDNKAYQCTVSGHTSMIHSASTKMTTACGAKPLSWYKKDSRTGKYNNWPGGASNAMCPVGGTNYRPTDRFNAVFGGGSASRIGALVDATYPNDEAHWVVAMLNATSMESTFPYTTLQVKTMYLDTVKRGAALTFFKSYLEG